MIQLKGKCHEYSKLTHVFRACLLFTLAVYIALVYDGHFHKGRLFYLKAIYMYIIKPCNVLICIFLSHPFFSLNPKVH